VRSFPFACHSSHGQSRSTTASASPGHRNRRRPKFSHSDRASDSRAPVRMLFVVFVRSDVRKVAAVIVAGELRPAGAAIAANVVNVAEQRSIHLDGISSHRVASTGRKVKAGESHSSCNSSPPSSSRLAAPAASLAVFLASCEMCVFA
jgi:hypothetical protein